MMWERMVATVVHIFVGGCPDPMPDDTPALWAAAVSPRGGMADASL